MLEFMLRLVFIISVPSNLTTGEPLRAEAINCGEPTIVLVTLLPDKSSHAETGVVPVTFLLASTQYISVEVPSVLPTPAGPDWAAHNKGIKIDNIPKASLKDRMVLFIDVGQFQFGA